MINERDEAIACRLHDCAVELAHHSAQFLHEQLVRRIEALRVSLPHRGGAAYVNGYEGNLTRTQIGFQWAVRCCLLQRGGIRAGGQFLIQCIPRAIAYCGAEPMDGARW